MNALECGNLLPLSFSKRFASCERRTSVARRAQGRRTWQKESGDKSPHSKGHSKGLSLLEVILALAILGGALAAIGELMRIGSRSAEIARDVTTAQMLCESKMSEFEVGVLPLQSVDRTPVEDLEFQDEWLYSVVVEQVDQQGLVAVTVTVQQNPDVFSRPADFRLTRWMIDETLLPTDTTTTSVSGGGSG